MLAADAAANPARKRACILLWMQGGPSHVDTFDMKPDSPDGVRSHFEQFTALLKAEGEVGRKAEFLLQEIGREVNTIGSKANDLTIARAVIELKNELERVREQIANVE